MRTLISFAISFFERWSIAHWKSFGCFSFMSFATAIVALTSTSASCAPICSMPFSSVRSVSLNDGAFVSLFRIEKFIPSGLRSLVALTRLMMSHLEHLLRYSQSRKPGPSHADTVQPRYARSSMVFQASRAPHQDPP